ncbi:hypothetical protein FRACA_1900008 [Frankia canadensis]|uniref:Uncharacterized protein n=1 Tax=Frankia canadensis TaxID=1836972 RepID=A0A2I2KPB6_9ACTN|nr:hypothetical protein FRACA_1900008 [Frankia canadensis]SOU54779.1 hypothetical protein FRACA_1900008 [Frankia canadensis]
MGFHPRGASGEVSATGQVPHATSDKIIDVSRARAMCAIFSWFSPGRQARHHPLSLPWLGSGTVNGIRVRLGASESGPGNARAGFIIQP